MAKEFLKKAKKYLTQFSICKTVRLNFHYFGIKGVFKTYMLCARNIKLRKLSGTVEMLQPRRGVQLGFRMTDLTDSSNERGIWQNEGLIRFEGNALLGSGVRIINSGEIVFGDSVVFTGRSSIFCKKKITIGGKDTMISWDCLIMDSDIHSIYYDGQSVEKANEDKQISIGEHVWIGCRCTLKKGAVISDNSVVSAGSVISKPVEENNVLIGDFGKILKRGIKWSVE